MIRPDGEAGTDPAVNGWHLYRGGGSMSHVQDEQRGKVLRLSSGSAGRPNGIFLSGSRGKLVKSAWDVKFCSLLCKIDSVVETSQHFTWQSIGSWLCFGIVMN